VSPLPIELHPEAVLEGQQARGWYEQRSPSAAEAFMCELDDAVQRIISDPKSWAEFRPGMRRVLFKRFPFSVVYRVLEDKIQIVAIAHARRRPGYWKLRST